METRWVLFSAAIFFGFLSSQVAAAEAVLGHKGIFHVIPGLKVVRMTILLQRPERPGFSAL